MSDEGIPKGPRRPSRTRKRTVLDSMRLMKRGPNGRRLCRWCGKEVQPPKLTFCGKDCIHEWRLRTDTGYVRRCVADRDRGICSRCGLNTGAIEQAVCAVDEALLGTKRSLAVVIAGKTVKPYQHLWEAHHKKAVVEGGGQCGLEGYETLCVWCHTITTVQLVVRRAQERRRKKGDRCHIPRS